MLRSLCKFSSLLCNLNSLNLLLAYARAYLSGALRGMFIGMEEEKTQWPIPDFELRTSEISVVEPSKFLVYHPLFLE